MKTKKWIGFAAAYIYRADGDVPYYELHNLKDAGTDRYPIYHNLAEDIFKRFGSNKQLKITVELDED